MPPSAPLPGHPTECDSTHSPPLRSDPPQKAAPSPRLIRQPPSRERGQSLKSSNWTECHLRSRSAESVFPRTQPIGSSTRSTDSPRGNSDRARHLLRSKSLAPSLPAVTPCFSRPSPAISITRQYPARSRSSAYTCPMKLSRTCSITSRSQNLNDARLPPTSPLATPPATPPSDLH